MEGPFNAFAIGGLNAGPAAPVESLVALFFSTRPRSLKEGIAGYQSIQSRRAELLLD
ncbi:hypothetical protein [Azospirillum sp.]|uniref:hypothetical protein n=1 Tax=Azospirillum sp. TaxID=34012 RepID=UPI003D712206